MNTSRSETLKGIFFVNVATFTWATNIILGRYLRTEVGPFTLTVARYIVAAVSFWILLRKAPLDERRAGEDLVPLVLMALTGIVLFAPLLYFGLRYTTAINGTLINGMGPLLTAVFAAWIIKEPYTRRQLGGALSAMVGVAILITGASLRVLFSLAFNPGDLVVLLAAAVWGLYSIAGRRATRNRSPLSATALSTYMGIPVLLLAAVLEQRVIPVEISFRLVGVIVYLGLVPAALGFSLWNAGVKKLGAGGAMVFYNMLPFYGAILGLLLLGETVGTPHLLGGALIIGGGVLSAVSVARSRRRGVEAAAADASPAGSGDTP